MERENPVAAMIEALRSSQPNLLLRIPLSLAAVLIALAGGFLFSWLLGWGHGGRVRDSDVALAFLAATGAWFLSVVWVWSPLRGGWRLVRPVLLTIVLGVGAVSGGAFIDQWLGGDEEFLIAAWVLTCAAGAVLVWMPIAVRAMRGNPVVGADGFVTVNCPKCGYSLVGLRDLRCPECGQAFTIDELIRAQNYDGVRQLSSEHPGVIARRLPPGDALQPGGKLGIQDSNLD